MEVTQFIVVLEQRARTTKALILKAAKKVPSSIRCLSSVQNNPKSTLLFLKMVSFSKLATFAGVLGLSIAGHDGRLSHGHPSATVDRSESPVSKPFEADEADPTHAFSHVNFKRGDLGVYECKGRNWKGPCTWTKADG